MADAAGRRAKAVRDKKADLPRHVSGCWPSNVRKNELRLVNGQKSKGEETVFASEAFLWKVYDGMKPARVHPLNAAPAWRLCNLLDRVLPGWAYILGHRWSALELIQGSNHILDAAFLNAVHMYKRMLGNRFPRNVFEWPPQEWLTTYRERKSKAAAATNEKKDAVLHAPPVPGAKHGLGWQPSANNGRSSPSDCAQPRPPDSARAKRAISGRQPSSSDRKPLPSDCEQPRREPLGSQPKSGHPKPRPPDPAGARRDLSDCRHSSRDKKPLPPERAKPMRELSGSRPSSENRRRLPSDCAKPRREASGCQPRSDNGESLPSDPARAMGSATPFTHSAAVAA